MKASQTRLLELPLLLLRLLLLLTLLMLRPQGGGKS